MTESRRERYIRLLKSKSNLDIVGITHDAVRELIEVLEEPERKWIPCCEPPENEENVFIAHGAKGFMACCIGHYDHDSGLWYEDRNWFARPIYDGMYWCEMPMLPETEG